MPELRRHLAAGGRMNAAAIPAGWGFGTAVPLTQRPPKPRTAPAPRIIAELLEDPALLSGVMTRDVMTRYRMGRRPAARAIAWARRAAAEAAAVSHG